MSNSKLLAAASLALAGPAYAQSTDQDSSGDVRVTASIPIAVKHFTPLPGRHEWNEGFFNNLGVQVQVDKRVASITDNVDLRVGGLAGFYKNSIYRTSYLLGANAELDIRLSSKFNLHIGTPAGVVTGYSEKFKPVIAPYAGLSSKVVGDLSLGLRAQWLPAKSLPSVMGMRKDRRTSDAIVGLVTASFDF